MKKTVLLIALLGLSYISEAQNTFPTTGNVGIGTVNPNSKLHIVNGNLQIGGATNSQYGIKLWRNSMSIGNIDSHGNVFRFAAAQAPNNYQFVLRNSGDVYFNDGQFYLDYSTANIGIGTTTPTEKLDVDGVVKGKSAIKIAANGTTGYIGSGLYLNSHHNYRGAGIFSLGQTNNWFIGNPYTDHANSFMIGVAPKPQLGESIDIVAQKEYAKFYINQNGNVGIGTVTPTESFEIFDSVNAPGVISLKSGRNDASYVDVGRLSAKQGVTEVARIGMPRAGGTYTGLITFWTKPTNTSGLVESMRIKENGNVGIGTSNPNSKLAVINPNVNDNAISQNTTALQVNTLHFGTDASDGHLYIQSHGSKPLYLNELGNDLILGLNAGDIGVGTNVIPDGYKMAVAGKVITEEVKVKLQSSWPDYVFKKDYNLPTLKDVEKHIKEKGHLKNIPSEKEVSKNGIQLGEMNAKLLQKIEELTLYTIAQEKKIKEQEGKITKQQKEINSLKKISERIKIIEDLLNSKK